MEQENSTREPDSSFLTTDECQIASVTRNLSIRQATLCLDALCTSFRHLYPRDSSRAAHSGSLAGWQRKESVGHKKKNKECHALFDSSCPRYYHESSALQLCSTSTPSTLSVIAFPPLKRQLGLLRRALISASLWGDFLTQCAHNHDTTPHSCC
jgi:hypothetical protein